MESGKFLGSFGRFFAAVLGKGKGGLDGVMMAGLERTERHLGNQNQQT